MHPGLTCVQLQSTIRIVREHGGADALLQTLEANCLSMAQLGDECDYSEQCPHRCACPAARPTPDPVETARAVLTRLLPLRRRQSIRRAIELNMAVIRRDRANEGARA